MAKIPSDILKQVNQIHEMASKLSIQEFDKCLEKTQETLIQQGKADLWDQYKDLMMTLRGECYGVGQSLN